MRYYSFMAALPEAKVTVEEFFAWAQSRPGRYELFNGEVVAQVAERAAHVERKFAICVALRDAIRRSGAPCHALVDGMAVKISKNTVYEPDAMVYCGQKLAADATYLESPIIVVEVLSPSSGRNDTSRKLIGYFSVPSVVHYLIVDSDEPVVIHHKRGEDGVILTRVLSGGAVTLDPPGLGFDLSELYA
jgi:Uma2 family endonuclease